MITDVNYYEILQVDRRADYDVIRAAYRVLARRHHPDLGGHPAQMAAVNQAWATLSDPTNRARYDAASRRATIQAAAPNAAAEGTVGVMETDAESGRPVTPPAHRAPGPGVLDFGRYAGWSVAELSRHDPDYLLWLERTPIGRSLRSEIQRAMEMRRPQAMATATGSRPPSASAGRLFRRS